MTHASGIRLSICIPTFNRAAFIGATLESIIPQLPADCEIVISDNASTDNTEEVVASYAHHFNGLHYAKQDTNKGLDRNFDRVVELAHGEYCWLFADDDILKPGAVAAVLGVLGSDVSLVIVNAEIRNFDLSKVLQPRWLFLKADRTYSVGEMDRLCIDANSILRYVGCMVIRRDIWISRERERHFGSLFLHVGVIFQKCLPGEVRILAAPLITYRMGNTHAYTAPTEKTRSLLWDIWPSLVSSMALSDSAKAEIDGAQSWRYVQNLLCYRALGLYSLAEYRLWVRPRLRSISERVIRISLALLPGSFANACLVLYCSVARQRWRNLWDAEVMLLSLRESRFFVRNWGVFKGKLSLRRKFTYR